MESRSNEGQLMLAIQAIDKNPELSIRATAKIYGVSEIRSSDDLITQGHDKIPCPIVGN